MKIWELELDWDKYDNLHPVVSWPLEMTRSFDGRKKLPEWEADCALVTIDGSYNKLGSITTLAGYKHLNEVLMDYNQLYYVNSLANCPKLIKVSVYGNEISDVSELTKKDIIVNYNPNY